MTIYDREGGALARVIDADRADQRAGRLAAARMSAPTTRDMNLVAQAAGDRRARRGRADPLHPRQGRSRRARISSRCDEAIADLERAGRPTDEARTGWWHKISGPLSTVLMPLLAALAAFGLARSGQVLLRATIGMALGFAYFVADNFSLALGNFGAYPPLLAAWAPFLLFLLIGEAVLDPAGRIDQRGAAVPAD